MSTDRGNRVFRHFSNFLRQTVISGKQTPVSPWLRVAEPLFLLFFDGSYLVTWLPIENDP